MKTKLTLLLEQAINDGVFPGCAYHIRKNGIEFSSFLGKQTYCPDSPNIDASTVWDLASVSKVVSTTTLTMIAVQNGKLELDWPVAKVIPEFGANGKQAITFRNLMVHDSGLIAFRPYYQTCNTRQQVLDKIFTETLNYPTGSKTVYSDLSMILMDEALARINNAPLERQFLENVANPLGLNQTGYFNLGAATSPEAISMQKCAPTERIEEWRKALRRIRHGDLATTRMYGHDPEYIQGEVHDPTATAMGGVAGHAGLFSTTTDLAKFVADFASSNPKAVKGSTRDQFIKRQSSQSSRALGWDTKSATGSSAGTILGPNSYGHTGYTGTSVWVDPNSGNYAILLSNRVHGTSENTKIISFRPKFHDTAFLRESQLL